MRLFGRYFQIFKNIFSLDSGVNLNLVKPYLFELDTEITPLKNSAAVQNINKMFHSCGVSEVSRIISLGVLCT